MKCGVVIGAMPMAQVGRMLPANWTNASRHRNAPACGGIAGKSVGLQSPTRIGLIKFSSSGARCRTPRTDKRLEHRVRDIVHWQVNFEQSYSHICSGIGIHLHAGCVHMIFRATANVQQDMNSFPRIFILHLSKYEFDIILISRPTYIN